MPSSEETPSADSAPLVDIVLYTSAFCGPCMQTRTIVKKATQLIAGARFVERDVTSNLDEGERLGIRSTPTVLIRDAAGAEVFRSEGVPTLPQVLLAAAHALPPG